MNNKFTISFCHPTVECENYQVLPPGRSTVCCHFVLHQGLFSSLWLHLTPLLNSYSLLRILGINENWFC